MTAQSDKSDNPCLEIAALVVSMHGITHQQIWDKVTHPSDGPEYFFGIPAYITAEIEKKLRTLRQQQLLDIIWSCPVRPSEAVNHPVDSTSMLDFGLQKVALKCVIRTIQLIVPAPSRVKVTP